MMLKSRTLAEKQRQRAIGDYSVTVDRSGMLLLMSLPSARRTFSTSHNYPYIRHNHRCDFDIIVRIIADDPLGGGI